MSLDKKCTLKHLNEREILLKKHINRIRRTKFLNIQNEFFSCIFFLLFYNSEYSVEYLRLKKKKQNLRGSNLLFVYIIQRSDRSDWVLSVVILRTYFSSYYFEFK